MPTFKHPCPYCGGFIARDVAACPYCGIRDPFVPGRCASCRAPIEDPGWVTCPKCGASLRPPAVGGPALPVPGDAPTPSPAVDPAVPLAEPALPAVPSPLAEPAPLVEPAPLAAAVLPPGPMDAPAVAAGACAGCGATLAVGARFCPACGTLAS